MAVTIGRSLRTLLVAIEPRRNFEFTVFNCKLGLRVSLQATSQISNDVRMEVSLELTFRMLHNARRFLSSRELFT